MVLLASATATSSGAAIAIPARTTAVVQARESAPRINRKFARPFGKTIHKSRNRPPPFSRHGGSPGALLCHSSLETLPLCSRQRTLFLYCADTVY